MYLSMNEWTVTGCISYLRELQGEFAASVEIKGVVKRRDNSYASDRLKLGCLLGHRVYREAKQKGFGLNRVVTLSGHLETWDKTIHGKPCNKIMFVADYVLEVS